MRNIVEKLQEHRQVEVAKSIVESAGYKVSKRLKESQETHAGWEFNKGSQDRPDYRGPWEPDMYTKDYKGVTLVIYPPGGNSYESWDGYGAYAYSNDVGLGRQLDTAVDEIAEKEFSTFEEAERSIISIVDKILGIPVSYVSPSRLRMRAKMKESKSTGALNAREGSTIIDTKTGKEGVVKKTGQSGNHDLLYVDFGDGKLRRIDPMDDAQRIGRYEMKESKSPRAVSLRSRKAK